MSTPIADFHQAIATAGIQLAKGTHIIADGQLHRASTTADKGHEKTAWYRLHLDAPIAGAAGDWRTGIKTTWTATRQSLMSPADCAALSARITLERAESQAETKKRHSDAVKKTGNIWENSEPASPDHPYLLKKCISPGGSRQRGDTLIIPIIDFYGEGHGLQFIGKEGSKLFLAGMAKSGHFMPTVGAAADMSGPIWITEGWATAMTVAALKPELCVIAACDAGNLLSVAISARKFFPPREICICPDFDEIGQRKGREAALAARARIVPPPPDLPPGITDYNDWHNARKGKS